MQRISQRLSMCKYLQFFTYLASREYCLWENSRPDGGADGRSERLGPEGNVFRMFGLDHDTRLRFRSRVAHDDSSGGARAHESPFRIAAETMRQGFQRGLGLHLYIHDRLGKHFQATYQIVERASQRDQAGDLERREKAVACGCVVQKNDVAGLFAAEIRRRCAAFLPERSGRRLGLALGSGPLPRGRVRGPD